MIGVLAVTFFIVFAAVAGVTPVAGVLARRLGLIDKPRPGRAHTVATPYLGGLAMLVGVATGLIVAVARGSLRATRAAEILAIAVGAAVLGILGLVDDWRPRPPRLRVIAEVLAAALVVLTGVRIAVTGVLLIDAAITILWIVGITNATNLLDNMDGLASGAMAIAAAGTAFLAYEYGQALVSVLAVAIGGAALGFLVHNRPPARIFMGDAGSLSLGFLLAVTVAKLDLVSAPGPMRLVVVVLLCGVGIMDTVLVVASRIGRKVSPFRGATDHSSHRLVRSGLSERRAILVLHAAGGWFVASAILLRRLDPLAGAIGIAIVGLVAAPFMSYLWRLPAEGPLPDKEMAAERRLGGRGVPGGGPATPGGR